MENDQDIVQYTPYPSSLVVGLFFKILFSSLAGRKRSFRRDAQQVVKHFVRPVKVLGQEYIPSSGPCLLTLNHFHRPGMEGYWLAMGISALVPCDIRWIMTSAWTFTGQSRGMVMIKKPVVRWFIGRIAHLYDFLRMPPVPPDPADAQERALAVRQVIQYARQATSPVIGLAPEGGDIYNIKMGWPPPGAGRFILHLNRLGMPVVPIGINEVDGALCYRFGPAYSLEIPPDLPVQEQDTLAIRQVMGAIAALLPEEMWGDFQPLSD
jgi:1-acyl-sn-glycerol-3-phosphate acyltransferase